MPRRERWSVIGAILTALDSDAGPDRAKLTTIAARANVAYDRLQAYLQDLTQAGLLVTGPDGAFEVTEKGREYLRMYRQWTEVLDRFGL